MDFLDYIYFNRMMTVLRNWMTRYGLCVMLFHLVASVCGGAELKLGVQSYMLARLDFDSMVAFAQKHKLKYIQLFDRHLGPHSSDEEIIRKRRILDEAGLVAYTFGVAATSPDKEENRKLFEFAKKMGFQLIVVEPGEFQILDNLEELVKEYDIRIAIHNHGIRSLYGNPAVVRALIMNRDPRIGVCMDAGWLASARFNPAQEYRAYAGRVFDIHLKDKKVSSTENGDVAVDTFIGEGDAHLDQLIKVAMENGYTGVFALESDAGYSDPTEHIQKAHEYIDHVTSPEVYSAIKLDEPRRGARARPMPR